ncbi:MAG: ribosome-associated translation inhibitor RaiA [Azoarcus sp.]|jgi:putative sigma-54 modulation protein|nr:ribosome-associated translation inhibitor RaiA [Azoarcus sp.]
MNINIIGHHIEITDAIRAYTSEKIDRAVRHADNVTSVNVILSVDKLNQKAEATVHVRGKDIHVECVDADLYAAVDALADKLSRQMQKHKQKTTEHHHDSPRFAAEP